MLSIASVKEEVGMLVRWDESSASDIISAIRAEFDRILHQTKEPIGKPPVFLTMEEAHNLFIRSTHGHNTY